MCESFTWVSWVHQKQLRYVCVPIIKCVSEACLLQYFSLEGEFFSHGKIFCKPQSLEVMLLYATMAALGPLVYPALHAPEKFLWSSRTPQNIFGKPYFRQWERIKWCEGFTLAKVTIKLVSEGLRASWGIAVEIGSNNVGHYCLHLTCYELSETELGQRQA